jgi:hypothetical protein
LVVWQRSLVILEKSSFCNYKLGSLGPTVGANSHHIKIRNSHQGLVRRPPAALGKKRIPDKKLVFWEFRTFVNIKYKTEPE